MFYGVTLKPGVPVRLNPEGGDVLHISGACLSNPASDERVSLILMLEGTKHVLCTLKKDQTENVSLDVFVPTHSDAWFKVQGKSEIHVMGYYEPVDSDDDDDDFPEGNEDGLAINDEDEDNSTQVSSDEEMVVGSKQKKIQEVDNDGNVIDDDDDDDDEEDEDDEEEEEEDDDDDDDDDAEERLKQALQEQLAKKKANKQDQKQKGKVVLAQPVKQPTSDKKRKAQEPPASTKPVQGKQPKTSGSQDVNSQFEKAVSDYLKKNGRSLISQIASACPKPSTVTTKYREFLVSRPSLFVVEGQHATLKV